jgi:hypothetical protein
MTTLKIVDLLAAEELDSTEMRNVRGGRPSEPGPVDSIAHSVFGPAGANIPAIWNSGVDGPIIIHPR